MVGITGAEVIVDIELLVIEEVLVLLIVDDAVVLLRVESDVLLSAVVVVVKLLEVSEVGTGGGEQE
jgi:hypothetical protein